MNAAKKQAGVFVADSHPVRLCRGTGVRDNEPINVSTTVGAVEARLLGEPLRLMLPMADLATPAGKAAKKNLGYIIGGPSDGVSHKGNGCREAENFPLRDFPTLDVEPATPQFVDHLRAGTGALSGMRYGWHTTISSTSEKPKLRIFLWPKQPLTAVDHRRCVDGLKLAIEAEHEGVGIDPTCGDAAHIMFTPAACADGEYDSGQNPGGFLDVDRFVAIAEAADEEAKRQAEEQRADAQHQREQARTGGYKDDAPEIGARWCDALDGLGVHTEAAWSPKAALASECPRCGRDGVARVDWTADGRYVCRVCGQGGNVITFVKTLEGIDGNAAFARCRELLGMAPRSHAGTRGAAFSQQADEEWGDPEPLDSQEVASSPYPVDALGPMAAAAVRALVTGVEAAESLAANVVLSGVNGATHAMADVETLSGRGTTLSLPIFTVAQSGDRKSECEHWVFKHAKDLETELRRIAKVRRADWKQSAKARRQSGEDTPPPPEAGFFIGDFTVEGLYRHLLNSHPAICVLSSEGGRLTGGHAMAVENTRKTVATLSDAIDKGVFEKRRAGNDEGDVGYLDGKRLCLHILIQPDGARAFLSNSVVIDQGFASRLLVAAPDRPHRTGRSRLVGDGLRAITAFSEAVRDGFGRPLTTDPGDPLRITPRYLRLSDEAETILRDYAAQMEERMNPGGDLEALQRFVNKTAEQATRIAACLYLFEGGTAPGYLPEEYAARGVTLAGWYVSERLRLLRAADIDPDLAKTWKLLRLIVKRGLATVTAGQIASWRLVDYPDVGAVSPRLQRLVRGGWLQGDNIPPTGHRGRPWATLFKVHPDAATLIRKPETPSEQIEKLPNKYPDGNYSEEKAFVRKLSEVRTNNSAPPDRNDEKQVTSSISGGWNHEVRGRPLPPDAQPLVAEDLGGEL